MIDIDLGAIRTRIAAMQSLLDSQMSMVTAPYTDPNSINAPQRFIGWERINDLENGIAVLKALVAEVEWLRRENENLFQHLTDDDQDYFRKEFGYVWQRR